MTAFLTGSAHVMTGAAFNRSPSEAKSKLSNGPVVVTDHGKPSFVLLSVEDFERNYRHPLSVGEALCDPNGMDDEDFLVERTTLASRDVEF